MLISLIVVIIPQCLRVSNRHVVHFKSTYFYLSITPQ